MTHSFLIWPEIETEAVLHYDDDVSSPVLFASRSSAEDVSILLQLLAPLADLEAAFQLWQSHRNQILGFEPRVVHCDGDGEHLPAGAAAVPATGALSGEIPAGCKYKFKLPDGHFDIVVS